jgi:hypothetical protein
MAYPRNKPIVRIARDDLTNTIVENQPPRNNS